MMKEMKLIGNKGKGEILKIFGSEYYVSSLGVIINAEGQEVKPTIAHKNYQKVTVRGFQEYVHKLVAEVFILNPDNKPMVLHKDDDHSHNEVENLYWGDYVDNGKDMVRNGNGPNKITEKVAKQIISDLQHFSIAEVARAYEVGRNIVGKIKRRETWTHLQ